MATPPKRRGGRVTAKGSGSSSAKAPAAASRSGNPAVRDTEGSSARYTPPIPREVRVSPTWVPVLMFALFGAGALLIIVNYLDLLPGGVSNGYLLVGLALILGGIVTATQYH